MAACMEGTLPFHVSVLQQALTENRQNKNVRQVCWIRSNAHLAEHPVLTVASQMHVGNLKAGHE